MKVVAIGANGVIGKAVVDNLQQQHEVISVGYSQGEFRVDIEDKQSIERLFEQVGKVDAIISMAGNGEMGTLQQTDDAGYQTVLNNKVMGQVNVARVGLNYLNHGGSITLTSGAAADHPMPGVVAISMGTAAVNAFVRSAALDMTNEQRLNAVSPSMVKETMESWGMDSSTGIAAKDVASYYAAAVSKDLNGQVLQAQGGSYQ
ncbi:short chain dehydrogenase [Vibrio sp. SCSIO 43135]|uniref:short chain dehydrogenase n=1 Tax=Vibrio sp. SCSIO 43135 TaxID=2819096 RepID=UPI002075FAFC|nr:short chain dehydrogenase [Vibrio sp. SCSIO 43135]USD43616.1 short chain dehydrogenase [Vibrio sp. SCSIO 43135]